MSQKSLAEATGISSRTLSRLENGETDNPPLRYLVNCALALGLDDWQQLVEDGWQSWLDLTGSGSSRPRRAKADLVYGPAAQAWREARNSAS